MGDDKDCFGIFFDMRSLGLPSWKLTSTQVESSEEATTWTNGHGWIDFDARGRRRRAGFLSCEGGVSEAGEGVGKQAKERDEGQ